MEDALRETQSKEKQTEYTVLILVLMEDALRVESETEATAPGASLNPCSNGRCSASYPNLLHHPRSLHVLILVLMEDALRGYSWEIFSLLPLVLILVLMEDALRGRALPRLPRIQAGVLILVLMEDALRATRNERKRTRQAVLILVLMEDALRAYLMWLCYLA